MIRYNMIQRENQTLTGKESGQGRRRRKGGLGKEQEDEFVFEFLSITRYSGWSGVRRGGSFE
jgi:uncharacterized glyoxalase superfamily metalloenzyme YdcJ